MVNRVERLVNLCIVGAGILFLISLTVFVLRNRSSTHFNAAAIAPGTKLNLRDQSFVIRKQTLVLVLSTDCEYCTASAPFYRRLAAETADKTGLVVITAQSPKETREYLDRLGISVNDVRQVVPSSIEVKATPSLVLIDSQGIVIRSWQGQLPPEVENEVLDLVK